MKFSKIFLFSLFLIILLLPLAQTTFSFFSEKKLNGFFQLSAEPDLKYFTWRRWFDGSFQEEYRKRTEDHVGFRNSLFRLHNQYDYSLFGITHAQGFIKGKDGYLFEEDYIHEYTGNFFIGRATLERKFKKLKALQLELLKKNTILIPVIEPGKASFFPELIPSHYNVKGKGLSNQEYFLTLFKRYDIEYLDLNRYFMEMKDTSRYPLFPRYGMHWSIYGVTLAVDTLIKYLEKASGQDLPGFTVEGIELSDSLRATDNDIGNMLNLVCPLPKVTAAYPTLKFESRQDKTDLSVLVIADSYYLNIINGFSDKIFGKQEYWYYNSKVYPDIIDNENPVYVDKSDLKNKLAGFNVILLMTSEINMHCGFWNFSDEAYQAFYPEHRESQVYAIENLIRNQREWFRFMASKARRQGVPLERMIRLDAEYSFYNDYQNLANKNREDSIAHIAIGIRQDPVWLQQLAVKAKERNLPLEEMLYQDAYYLYEQQKNK
jgi:hypothetical protein